MAKNSKRGMLWRNRSARFGNVAVCLRISGVIGASRRQMRKLSAQSVLQRLPCGDAGTDWKLVRGRSGLSRPACAATPRKGDPSSLNTSQRYFPLPPRPLPWQTLPASFLSAPYGWPAHFQQSAFTVRLLPGPIFRVLFQASYPAERMEMVCNPPGNLIKLGVLP